MLIKKQTLIGVLLLLIVHRSVAQLDESMIKKIDQLFKATNSTSTPGFAIGIVRNDSLLFSKGYGMANLETAMPNSPEAVYMIASCSKQFTAYCIVLLVKQGKVKLDEDIQTYLPWFPDLKDKITVRHLLNHTSGLRDGYLLCQIAGTRWEEVFTQDDILRLLARQRSLNFKPNSIYSYSNSNYVLLAEIIKAVSHQTMRTFADSALFKPLNMTHTFICDNHLEIIPNRASGYAQIAPGSYMNMMLNRSSVGATNVYTTIGDLAKWISNFYMIKVGDATDIALLTDSKAKPDDGEASAHAFGIFNYKYRGCRLFEHEGQENAHVAQILVFPDQKMGIAICGNIRDSECRKKAFEIANLFIDKGKKKTETEEMQVDSSRTVLANPSAYDMYTGNYMDAQGTLYTVILHNNKLYLDADEEQPYLLQVQKQTAIPVTEPEHKFIFEIKNNDTLLHQKWPSGQRTLKKFLSAKNYSLEELNKYVGTYYCEELDCKYSIVLREHELVMVHNRYEDNKMNLIGKSDLFGSEYWWMSHLTVTRNSENLIDGFEVNTDRIRHLKFKKGAR